MKVSAEKVAMNPTILIAEDNDSVAAPLEQLLQKNGYEVVRANDGAEALSMIVSRPPALLLLDLKMPRLHGVSPPTSRLHQPGLPTAPPLTSIFNMLF